MNTELREGRLASYAAIVSYHNAVVSMRFSVAGLYMTGFAVLAAVSFNTHGAIPVGLTIGIAAWILEWRNWHVLVGLVDRGLKVEEELQIGAHIGYFALMKEESMAPMFSRFRRSRLADWRRLAISHTVGLNVLYGGTLAVLCFVARDKLLEYLTDVVHWSRL